MAKKTVITKRRGKFTLKTVTDGDLDKLAEITDQDIEEAKAFAAKHGSPLFRQLLDAE